MTKGAADHGTIADDSRIDIPYKSCSDQ